jgi:hypothetical protein
VALIDDFKARFPEFATATVDTYLPILEPVWPCYYGKEYTACNQEAVLNLVAHLLTLETTAGSASAQTIASKSVGSVSVSYAAGVTATTELQAFFKSSKYGQRFLLLTSRNYGGVAV